MNRLDAVHSSGAEGATTTFTDLLEYQSALRRAPDPEDAASVAGCAAAFDDLQDEPFDPCAAALAIHRRLFVSARDTGPASLPAALREWRDFTMADGGPELLRQALAHWMFEHIHPLDDGNGRVGRLLLPLALRARGATVNACGFVGEAVHSDKDIYIAALKRGRQSGDMGAWARIFLALVARNAQWNLARLEKLGQVYDEWRRLTAGLRAHSVAHRLLPWIIVQPAFTIRDALAGVGQGTFASVNAAVTRLAALGIVVPAGQAARDRLFTAPAVMALFEAPGFGRSMRPT